LEETPKIYLDKRQKKDFTDTTKGGLRYEEIQKVCGHCVCFILLTFIVPCNVFGAAAGAAGAAATTTTGAAGAGAAAGTGAAAGIATGTIVAGVAVAAVTIAVVAEAVGGDDVTPTHHH